MTKLWRNSKYSEDRKQYLMFEHLNGHYLKMETTKVHLQAYQDIALHLNKDPGSESIDEGSSKYIYGNL